MLINIYDPPSEGNFRDEYGKAIKPAIVADYNRHVGYSTRPTGWPTAIRSAVECGSGKKLFFHLFDKTILNSYILLSTSGKKISEIFDSPLSGRYWQELDMNPDRPGPYGDLPLHLRTLADSIHVTSTGQATTQPRGDVACVQSEV